MVEPDLFDLATKVLSKFQFPALQDIGLPGRVKVELEKLGNTAAAVSGIFTDAEVKQTKNNEVLDWLKRLQFVFNEIDDLLDDLFSGVPSRAVMMTKSKWAKKVRIFFSRLNQLACGSLKMAQKIKAIVDKLDAIAAERMRYHVIDLYDQQRELRFENIERWSCSFLCKDYVVGREKDKKAILELLLDSDSNSTTKDNVSIIPVVGIGGVGKTTLAQLVYNDERVNENFHLKMWVCVSVVFDVLPILRNIIESATMKKYEIVDMEQVVRDLSEIIAEKKYLLVLDDVWSEDPMRWSLDLEMLLRGGARGSKILLTTRSQSVARIVGTVSPFFLEGLSESESWSLFKQRAFRHEAQRENSTLVAVGKEIVKKCAGGPLAIICVGGQLHCNETENEWLYYKDKGLFEICGNKRFFESLKLSYDYLPRQLKRCFAYCSVFPKGHRIDKQILIQWWIAQGFIHLSDETQQPEDVGDQYFMHLLNQSFFQDVWEGLEGNVISCKMHDLIHDLAHWISEGEDHHIRSDVIDFAGSTHHAGSIRHVTISTHMDLAWEIRAFSEQHKLKAFVLATQERRWGLEKELEHIIFSNENITSFKSARVLDLHGLGIKRVPSSIGDLTRLRFLDLSNNSFQLLPEFICMLQNLERLKLNGCKYLKELPRETKNLISLRHLEIQGCSSLNYMPRGLGKLTSLRTLRRFVLDRKDKSTVGFSGGLSELEGLVNLRGTLSIEGLRGSIAEELRKKGPKKYYLDRLEFLVSLTLIWDGDEHDAVSDDELLLESLRPPPNIKKLFIHRYVGVNIGMYLPNLVEVELSCCCRCQHLTTFGLFPLLQVLRLSVMESLEYIYEEDYDFPSSSSYSEAQGLFPSLKQLHLYCLNQLKGLGSRTGVKESILQRTNAAEKSPYSFGATLHLTALQELRISSCPQLDLYADDKERMDMRLRSLTFLSVSAMPQLVSLPLWLQSLTNLQPIQIHRCQNLILPEWTGNLGSLPKLQIGADLELEAH